MTASSTYGGTGRHIPWVSRYMSRTVLVAMVFKGRPLSPPSSVLYLLFRLSGRWTVVLDTISPSTPLWGKWEHTVSGLYCCVPCYTVTSAEHSSLYILILHKHTRLYIFYLLHLSIFKSNTPENTSNFFSQPILGQERVVSGMFPNLGDCTFQ